MESIYHWIEHEEPPPPKRERHRSRFDPRQPPTGSTFVLPNTTKVRGANLGSESTEAVMRHKNRSGTATIGPPRESLRPDPRSFRKSPTAKPGMPYADPPPVHTHTHRQRRKPAVPSREDKPVYGVRSSKNFVVSNAVENILAVPQRKTNEEVSYRTKADYGKMPKYLGHVKREIEEERVLIEEMYMQREAEMESEAGHAEELTSDERDNLLAALKEKWDDMNKRYQQMTHMTKLDTIGKVRRKERYEEELAQLEKDISMLSQKRPIVVTET